MANNTLYILLFCTLLTIGSSVPFSEDNGVRDSDSNTHFDLLEVLREYADENTHRRREKSSSDRAFANSLENWTGRWFPDRPGDPQPPPKIVHNNQPVHNTISHKYIPMGSSIPGCDDGKTNLTIDMIDYSPAKYTCFGEKIMPESSIAPYLYCARIPNYYMAMHKCMDEPIEYDEDIPLFGTHRPIWAVYGEYNFLPKQRWLHNLEHGGIVMLYHPCANQLEVNRLKKVVKECVRKHIITPYHLLDEKTPLAVLSWGCRLTMSYVDATLVKMFIRLSAGQAPESSIHKDGVYSEGLINQAQIVSDIGDSVRCPSSSIIE